MTTILVVDDSAVDRRFVGELLKRDGDWRIEFAENGSEALARMKETQPDLVVTDLMMPGMDGFQLLRELGRGAFARVYLARQPALGNRVVVVKVAQYGSGEAETLGRLAHRNIVPVYSVR